MTRSAVVTSSFPPPVPRTHSTSSTASPVCVSHFSTPHHRKSSSGSLNASIGEETASDEGAEQWTASTDAAQAAGPTPRKASTHSEPSSHSTATTAAGPQSMPTISRRLGQAALVYRAQPVRTPTSQPGASPQSHPLFKSAPSAPAPYHADRDIPLAPHPSFSLHHRQHHLHRFLSSPLGTALLLNKLRSGSIFLKHGQRGSPHYRFLWVSEDLAYLHYSELKTKNKVRDSVEVRTLSRVDEGHCSPTFARSRSSDPLKCLSVVGEGRTLDLECLSEEEREMWVIAFSFLIEFTRRGGSSASGQQMDLSSIPSSLSLVSALELLCEQNQTLAQSKQPQSSDAHAQQQQLQQHPEEERKESAGIDRRSGEMPADGGSSVSYTIGQQQAPAQQQQGSPSLRHVSPTSSIRVSHVNRFEVRHLHHTHAHRPRPTSTGHGVALDAHCSRVRSASLFAVVVQVIDIIDESIPAPSSHHVAANLPLVSLSLSLPASAYDDERMVRLARDLEQYKEDNKRLLVSHARKMIRLQKEIDGLMEMNRKLRGMKTKADRTTKRPATQQPRDCAGSDGELAGDASDDSDDL